MTSVTKKTIRRFALSVLVFFSISAAIDCLPAAGRQVANVALCLLGLAVIFCWIRRDVSEEEAAKNKRQDIGMVAWVTAAAADEAMDGRAKAISRALEQVRVEIKEVLRSLDDLRSREASLGFALADAERAVKKLRGE